MERKKQKAHREEAEKKKQHQSKSNEIEKRKFKQTKGGRRRRGNSRKYNMDLGEQNDKTDREKL